MGLVEWFERKKLQDLAAKEQQEVVKMPPTMAVYWKSFAAAALAGGLTASADAISTGLHFDLHALVVFLSGALAGGALYLRQSPLPPPTIPTEQMHRREDDPPGPVPPGTVPVVQPK